ncbi:MAG: bifunctional diaminohydroxyphosphoribosylaminopyrimidine deaminase/5-amino-6-(5-phosphoribosylamino)uracil reductase RibD [Pseudomonadota bacterium]
MSAQSDARYMALALHLGARRLGQVWPNPAVGCVVVRDGRIVGRGATAPGGRPHAEPRALAQAGDAARGATVYVSLEPCAHHGKTPPCCEALIAAGVARVVSAMEDPDPRTAGQGHAALRAAGIAVDSGVLVEDAARLHRGFVLRVTRGRPFVTLKLAGSFDGRIATATGESRWITGPDARRRVHAARACHDLVLVGGGTARADDPDLRVRDLGVTRQPVRAVASRHLNLPVDGRLATSAAEGPVWVIHDPARMSKEDPTAAALRAQGVELVTARSDPGGQLNAGSMLEALGARGITRVFCEGGGALAASLLQADLVDEVIGFTAGLMLGAEGRPALGALGVSALAEAPRFRLVRAERIGADVLHVWERGEPLA